MTITTLKSKEQRNAEQYMTDMRNTASSDLTDNNLSLFCTNLCSAFKLLTDHSIDEEKIWREVNNIAQTVSVLVGSDHDFNSVPVDHESIKVDTRVNTITIPACEHYSLVLTTTELNKLKEIRNINRYSSFPAAVKVAACYAYGNDGLGWVGKFFGVEVYVQYNDLFKPVPLNKYELDKERNILEIYSNDVLYSISLVEGTYQVITTCKDLYRDTIMADLITNQLTLDLEVVEAMALNWVEQAHTSVLDETHDTLRIYGRVYKHYVPTTTVKQLLKLVKPDTDGNIHFNNY